MTTRLVCLVALGLLGCSSRATDDVTAPGGCPEGRYDLAGRIWTATVAPATEAP